VPQSRQRLRGSFVTCRQFGQVHTDHGVRAWGAAVLLDEGIVAVMVLMRPPLLRDAAGP
jgi:hypothetical protein